MRRTDAPRARAHQAQLYRAASRRSKRRQRRRRARLVAAMPARINFSAVDLSSNENPYGTIISTDREGLVFHRVEPFFLRRQTICAAAVTRVRLSFYS
jgi:hypothetical protein